MRDVRVIELFSGLSISIKTDWASVFVPTSSGIRIARHLALLLQDGLLDVSNRRVLDLGAGSGLLGILAAKYGAKVLCTDISENSLTAIGQNADLNNVKVEALITGGLSNLHAEAFDIIITNPPQLPTETDPLGNGLILETLNYIQSKPYVVKEFFFAISNLNSINDVIEKLNSIGGRIVYEAHVVEKIEVDEFWSDYEAWTQMRPELFVDVDGKKHLISKYILVSF